MTFPQRNHAEVRNIHSLHRPGFLQLLQRTIALLLRSICTGTLHPWRWPPGIAPFSIPPPIPLVVACSNRHRLATTGHRYYLNICPEKNDNITIFSFPVAITYPRPKGRVSCGTTVSARRGVSCMSALCWASFCDHSRDHMFWDVSLCEFVGSVNAGHNVGPDHASALS